MYIMTTSQIDALACAAPWFYLQAAPLLHTAAARSLLQCTLGRWDLLCGVGVIVHGACIYRAGTIG